jgi:hypothetical protein
MNCDLLVAHPVVVVVFVVIWVMPLLAGRDV